VVNSFQSDNDFHGKNWHSTTHETCPSPGWGCSYLLDVKIKDLVFEQNYKTCDDMLIIKLSANLPLLVDFDTLSIVQKAR